MTIGKFIENRRHELNMSRNALATKSGISHTEIRRIEHDERKYPSFRSLSSLSDALDVPIDDLVMYAGYVHSDNKTTAEKAFPSLQTKEQVELLEYVADGLSRNGVCVKEDLDDLKRQIDMFFSYGTKTKKFK